jgi:branched-chain amino acid transport system ATP-binding protein
MLHAERSFGIVIIEHDMAPDEAGASASVLDAGKTLATGSPNEIRSDPRVIEAYLGAPRLGVTMLRVGNLQVYYGRVAGAERFPDVAAGEIVGLLGPTARQVDDAGAIAGLVKAHAGTVLFESENVLRLAPENVVRRGIALVPENRRIFGHLTVQENLWLGATVRSDRAGVDRDIERIFRHFPVLKRLYKSAAGGLSGGEQQQLAIGRARALQPKLLLLDEPSLGLAPLLVKRVFEVIAELRSEGVTILLAEQYVARTLELADRVYSLSRGQVALAGRARTSARRPISRRTTFSGSPRSGAP